ncbi:kinesin-like protein KIN-12E isoform X1 [Ananas comosus]|uniref:Kinesin-like protein KIN-12E isoform X1 n=1 Tax=Ananas comosus TaxID=4615 RepID=A0A6P5GS28_ANACO|nr:kinesin-like protein KIN-12E isoform X1 [Ananas comosus]XP_020108285.1 kinesin-like protein KIN-12E isoform X1 [Ananas comosus]
MVENCMSGYNSCMFAYGQTGSGKTYTMMGEVHEMDNSLCEDRGITPRIFEYLFMQIREEEERRSNEQLRFSCKCSFLEIYNEQITDLLEPSSTNLQLREDMKKGVYVENLKECDVSSVKDVVELLLQGAANRKIAATNMNNESSRSHSVFTCVIESRWEKDSMTHLRFGRLNLVDLAGSERQKSSGAEGERLKEAANINRSLSTLGLVIMTLVDIANGKNRHVPYRDSRLTFLLQDSLGGNSKTTIVANVSPSICSSSETLSTLKFAQRAKLIQNNAKVNEDASGDVMALQRQVQDLKDQLTYLKNHQIIPISLCYPSSSSKPINSSVLSDEFTSLEGNKFETFNDSSLLQQKVNDLESALVGSMRREKLAEAEVRRLEAEIKHMNRLVHLLEDDAQRTRVILKLRDEKLRRLELLADDLVSSDVYLMEENVALSKEIQLLRERIDRNPDLSKFALENIRLVEQLRMLQNFYEGGGWEALSTEISQLRNCFLNILEGKYAPDRWMETQGDESLEELDSCRRQLDEYQKNYVLSTRDINMPNCLCQLEKNQDIGKLLAELEQVKQDNDKFLELAKVDKEQDPERWKEQRSQSSESSSSILINADKAKFEELHKQVSILTRENSKFRDLVAAKEAEIAALSEEWEKAIVDLSSFLLDGCKSLEDASEHIGNVVKLCPHKNLWVNEQFERAVKMNIEKENLISDLQSKLHGARKTARELKTKLDSLRGAAIAISEVQQQENDEGNEELLHLKELLHEKDSQIEELENLVKSKEGLVVEAEKTADAASLVIQKLYDRSPAEPLDVGEVTSTFDDLDPHCKVKLDYLLQHIEEKAKQVPSLLSKFEKAQETMEEAEMMMKALLKANEDSKHERDFWKQATQVVLTEKATIIEDLHRSEALNSSVIRQAYANLEEISELASSIEGSFHEIQKIKMEEMNSICSEMASFGQVVKRWIGDLKSFLINIISEITEKDFESHVLYQCQIGALIEQIKHSNVDSSSLSCTQIRSSSMCSNVQPCLAVEHVGGTKELLNEAKTVRDMVSVELDNVFIAKPEEFENEIEDLADYLSLKGEFARKDDIIEGLFFDLRLLQESTSYTKDMKDKIEETVATLIQVQHELAMKTSLVESILETQKILEIQINESEAALHSSRYKLEQAQNLCEVLSRENKVLRDLMEDELLKNGEMEKQLEEKSKVINSLESQILLVNSSVGESFCSSVEEITEELKAINDEKVHLQTEIFDLNGKLEMAMTLVDEKEAIAVEARQVAEASKIYAEEKEEEVKILEHSIGELEATIGVLEKKVYDLKEQVESYQLIRKALELEVEALTGRILWLENSGEGFVAEGQCVEGGKSQLSSKLDDGIAELCEARKCIEDLEMESKLKEEEIKQYKDHISELVLHSEAQSSLFQEKFKVLEHMISSVKVEPSASNPEPGANKLEKTSARTRGSSSPFRCLTNMVQQMSMEKDQELAMARLRIEELEALVSNKQKEVCQLTARLATVDTMTHDVIRDLLGIKLDMTNYANLIDQEQLQKLLTEYHEQTEKSKTKDMEILNLKKQIDHLIHERNSLIEEIDQRSEDILACQLTVERLQQREQLLLAQNEMLKVDKASLHQKIIELDETMELIAESRNSEDRTQKPRNSGGSSGNFGSDEFSKRLAQSDKLLSHARHELPRYRKSSNSIQLD